MLSRRCKRLGRRASVSVEFAILSVFFLLPLFAVGVDMVEWISAEAQMNVTMQALYYYGLTYSPGIYTPGTAPTALNDPTAIVNLTDVQAVGGYTSSPTVPITVTATSVTYACVNAAGTASSPAPTTNNSCTAAYPYEQITASFTITGRVNFSLPVPVKLAQALTLTKSGTVQIFQG